MIKSKAVKKVRKQYYSKRKQKQHKIKQKMKHNKQPQLNRSHIMTKSMINETKSITESICPKYRKFTNFLKSQSPQQQGKINTTMELYCQQQKLMGGENTIEFKTDVINKEDINLLLSLINNNNKRTTIKSPPPITLLNKIYSKYDNQPQSPQFKLRNKLASQYSPTSIHRPYNEQKVRQQITSTFNQLNLTISNISELFEKRMKTHEDELLKIMMQEIKRLNHECQKTIETYNELIKLKSTDSTNDELIIQLELYKKHALAMQQENEMLKKEIQYMKRLNNQYELRIKTDQDALRQATKKLLFYKNKAKYNFKNTIHNELATKSAQNIKQQSSSVKRELDSQLSIVKDHSLLLPGVKNIEEKSQQLLQQSKLIPLTKANSKSLNYTRRLHQYSIQQSLQSPKIATQVMNQLQNNYHNQNSLQSTLLIKLNQSINQKYKSHQKVDQISNQELPQSNLDYKQSSTVMMNREKVIRFLKESHPSIKSIISEKKSLQGKKQNKQFINQIKQRSSENKIVKIKNRVRLSSFDQQQFLALKKSLQMSLVQREKRNNENHGS